MIYVLIISVTDSTSHRHDQWPLVKRSKPIKQCLWKLCSFAKSTDLVRISPLVTTTTHRPSLFKQKETTKPFVPSTPTTSTKSKIHHNKQIEKTEVKRKHK